MKPARALQRETRNVLEDVEVSILEVASDEFEYPSYAKITTTRNKGGLDTSYIFNRDAFPALLACLAARLVKGDAVKLGVSIETANKSLEQTILEVRNPSDDPRVISKVAVPSLRDGYYAQIFNRDSQSGYLISHVIDDGHIDFAYASIIGCIEGLRLLKDLKDPAFDLCFKRASKSEADTHGARKDQLPNESGSTRDALPPPAPGDNFDTGVPAIIRVPDPDYPRDTRVTIGNYDNYRLGNVPDITNIGMTILLQFAQAYQYPIDVWYVASQDDSCRWISRVRLHL